MPPPSRSNGSRGKLTTSRFAAPDGSIAGPYPVLPGETPWHAVPQSPLDIEPYVGGEAERTHYAFGPSDARSLFARVLAIRPRGERVEIAWVGEHDAVHVN